MDIFKAPYLKALFETSVPRVIVTADAPNFTILTYNAAFKEALFTEVKEEVIGKFLWEAYNLPLIGEAGNTLHLALTDATENSRTVNVPPFSYDNTVLNKAKTYKGWLQFEIVPVTENDGKTSSLIITIHEITDKIKYQEFINDGLERERNLNRRLTEANKLLSEVNEKLLERDTRLRHIISDAPVAISVLRGPEYIVESANTQALKIWNKSIDVIGKPLTLALPEIKGQHFLKLIDDVFTSGIAYQGYEVKGMVDHSGILKEGYFNFIYKPLSDNTGHTSSILITASDVTEQVRARQKQEILNDELAAANQKLQITQQNLQELNSKLEEKVITRTQLLTTSEARLRYMIDEAPVAIAIFTGWDLIIESANEKFLEIGGKTKAIIGKPLRLVRPELEEQSYFQILENILTTGLPHYGNEAKIFINKNDTLHEGYYNFVNYPIKDASGITSGIFVVATEVTEQVKAQKKVQSLNKELLNLNGELEETIFKLTKSNDEIAQSQLDLYRLIDKLELSELRFKAMVEHSPVAMLVTQGKDMIITTFNPLALKMIGKDESILLKPILEAIPEIKGQPIIDRLYDAFHNSKESFVYEEPVMIYQEGKPYMGFFNINYKPIIENGQTVGVMHSAVDVTEQVLARKSVQNAEEMLRFSVESANIATWYIDIKKSESFPSKRLKEFFGYDPDEEMPYEDALLQIPVEYRHKVTKAIESTLSTGEGYNIEYPIVGYHDQKLRWVRAVGKVEKDGLGNLSHFSGVLIDITEQKQDEIRKNDFIGMVSHELKTPLTSLTAITQMLYIKAQKNGETFYSVALKKSTIQLLKMRMLINGFLNVSRLESGKILLLKTEFNLNQLINDVVNDVILTASSHKIKIIECKSIMVNADQEKISSVINNLLTNAIKYSEIGTAIEVKCEKIENKVQVSISDEGMGIHPQDIEKLFDRYYRVESTQTKFISGFGIGLYLSAEIVHRHDGKIWVESELAKGSTFHFDLPLE